MEYKPSFSDQLDIDYISHHGIRGMHWGVRRYQNPDGSLTPAGKRRYDKTKKALQKADMYDKTADYLNSQIKKDTPSFEKARLMTQATRAQRMSKRTRKHLDPNMVKKIQTDREIEEQKRKIERDKEYHNSPFNRGMRFMDDAMYEVFGKNAKPNYMNIYKEMSKDKRFRKLLDSEDSDDYKEAEVAWLKKHGFWDSYLDAVHNGYKDME